MGEKSGIWSWLWVHKIVLTGGLPPPRPPAVPGGLPAPQTPWQGAWSPPCSIFERLRLSSSPFFLVPRSWYQAPNLGWAHFFFVVLSSRYHNFGSGYWYQVACRVPNVACHAVSIPFVSKSSVSCRVINLRVGVSVPCRGHPACHTFLFECTMGMFSP